MKVMVVGAGEVGFHIADLLSREQHAVTVVEKDAQHAAEVRDRLNVLVAQGNGASTDVLEAANISDMELFIAVTDLDEVNLIACLLAHDHGVPRIIARIRSLEYTKAEWTRNAARLGVGLLINPQTVVAEDIFHSVSYSAATEVAEFARGRVVFLGYPIAQNSPLAGVSMRTLGEIRGLYRMVVTAISRQGQTITPRGEDLVEPGDTLYFVCSKRDLPAVTTLFGFEERETKSIFVLGGRKIGAEVAGRLAQQRYRVKIVERDADICEELAANLEGVHVLNTKGTDMETL